MNLINLKNKIRALTENVNEIYQLKKIEREKFIGALDKRTFDFQVATWFGSGLIIPASGTWGTIGGILFGIPLLLLTNSLIVLLTAIILFFVGLKSVEELEKRLPDHDSSFIVIDEVVAILICIALLPKDYLYLNLIIVFALFRYFDAKKPWIISYLDKNIKGAMGVMLDDIVAAIFSVLSLWLIIFVSIFFLII
jgi:phosphatidylglycerophosphatase A